MGPMHEAPKLAFYDVISEANINAENWLMTVVNGDHAGEKAMMSAGEFAWFGDEDGFIKAHAEELKTVTDSGIVQVDEAKIYAELLGGEKHIVICGAGHVSMPIISIGKMMGCSVTVIDDRLKFANDAIAQGADEVLVLSHRADNRNVYAAGAMQAARFIAGVDHPGLYGMEDLLQI